VLVLSFFCGTYPIIPAADEIIPLVGFIYAGILAWNKKA